MDLSRKIRTVGMILKRHQVNFEVFENNDFTIGGTKNGFLSMGLYIAIGIIALVLSLMTLILGSGYFVLFVGVALYMIFLTYTKYQQKEANSLDVKVKDGMISFFNEEGNPYDFLNRDIEHININLVENENLIIGKIILEGSSFEPTEILRLIDSPEYIQDDLNKIAEVIQLKLDAGN